MSETIVGIDRFSNKPLAVSDMRRQAGKYVIGVQGVGKSSFLESLIYQDICKGYSTIVIDPARDLIDHVIAQMPDDALKKTFLLDLSDVDWPFGLNSFAIPAAHAKDIKLRQLAIDRVVRSFEKLFDESLRMMLGKILLMASHLLIDNPGTSLASVPRMLYDDAYRGKLVKNCINYRARQYWQVEYNSLSASKKQAAIAPLMNRIPSLLANPMLENIVSQKTSTIDFRRSIDNAEVILIRLPLNEFGQIAPIVGTLLVSEIFGAVFSYADVPLEKRPGCSLFIDEYQNFSTPDIAKLFTQGRKFRIRLTVAHQTRDQLTEENLSSSVTADTVVAFRLIAKNARELASLFVDQAAAATIRERVVLPDVVSRLPYHNSESVQAFYKTYIAPLQLKAKEPLPPPLQRASSLQTHADLLRFVEKLMYMVQKLGKFFEKEGEISIAEQMYFKYLGISAYLLGFHNYHLSMYEAEYNGKHPDTMRFEEQAQRKLAPLQETLAQKQKPLESALAFRAFLGQATTSFDAHLKDRYKRRYLPQDVKSRLFFEEEPFEMMLEPDPRYDLPGWLTAFVKNNRLLKSIDSLEKMVMLKRVNLEKKRALLSQQRADMQEQKMRKEGSFGYFMYRWRGSLKYSHISLEIRDLEVDIKNLTKHIERIEDHLKSDTLIVRYDASEDKVKELLSFCSFYAALDTPEKVLAWVRSLYEEKEVAPLHSQIQDIQGRLATDLDRLATQLLAEKALHERFDRALASCLRALVNAPICEQKPLTDRDTAMILEGLPRRCALVRRGKSDTTDSKEPGVFLITTLDTPAHVEPDVFNERFEAIRQQTRATYCRSRIEVEAEIHAQETTSEADELDTDRLEDTGDTSDDDDLLRFDE